ncbi:MAG: hypothetical protein EKK40_06975 [Bradyrhizobiaceae bacterium]|nr:MAG: hypothetical protein EKK40_06975 [Bradyrhizobiaceae bacterium]
MKALIVSAALLLTIGSANALTCSQVRRFVAEHGVEQTIELARSMGMTERDIALIRRVCLK